MKNFYVYIMASKTRVLYTGMTNNLVRRVIQHKQKVVEGFSQKYNTTRLVYFETFSDARSAIRREKYLKGWLRAKKVVLIESVNPRWKDLSADWFRDEVGKPPRSEKRAK